MNEEFLETMDTKDKLSDYLSLCDLTYEEAVNSLNVKYGDVTDDYFRKESYKKFLKGIIRTPHRGNVYVRKELIAELEKCLNDFKD